MPLVLDKERVGPTGNIMSKGILNQLGRPDLDSLAVLVREAVQNSWDARANDQLPVRFGIDGWTLTTKQKDALHHIVFAEKPPAHSLPLTTHLERDELSVFVLHDRGTVGLGGPTRADVMADDNETQHFVDFLRNIGQPTTQQFTGGTYGYGKAAFYRASRSRTICVHTRCRHKGELETRFIAAALGDPYVDQQSKYTGRFWWGRQGVGNLVDPILDEEADQIASELGLPPFDGEECGTSIMVIEPYMGERTPLQAANLMAEYILWYFWPKMLTNQSGYPGITFHVSWQGQRITLPRPESYPPLQGFVKAMRQVEAPQQHYLSDATNDYREIASQKPKQTLGHLALQKFSVTHDRHFDTGPGEPGPFNHITHHTALMRQPKLVVKYLQGPVPQNDSIGYAGVFVTHEEVDAVFADSEPPTHDDWISSSLEDRAHRVFVNQAIKRTHRAMEEFAGPIESDTSAPDAFHTIGTFATKLGQFLLGEGNNGNAKLTPPKQSPPQSSTEVLADGLSINTYGAQNATLQSQSFELSDEQFELLRSNPMATVETLKPHDHSNPSEPQSEIGKAKLHYLSDGHLFLYQGQPAVKVDFMVEHADNSIGTLIRARATVVVDGNQSEGVPPGGQGIPKILAWFAGENHQHSGGDTLFLPRSVVIPYSVIVSVPENVMLRVDLQTTSKA